MFYLSIRLGHRNVNATCHSVQAAARIMRAYARQQGVAVDALDWSATR